MRCSVILACIQIFTLATVLSCGRGGRSVESAIVALASPDSLVRRSAAMRLEGALKRGLPQPNTLVPALTKILDEDQSVSVRLAVISALGATGDTNGMRSLVTTARDTAACPVLRATALRVLLRSGFTNRDMMLTASDCLRSPDLRLRHVSIDVLSTSKEREFLSKLVDVYKRHHDLPERHLMEIRPLGTTPRKRFANAYEELSWHLAASLDSVGQLTPDLLVPLFEHENAEVRSVAIEASVPTLIEWLKNKSLEDARWFAAKSLGASGDPRALKALVESAEDRDNPSVVIWSAQRALARGNFEKTRGMVVAARNLSADNHMVRMTAIELLSRSDDREDLVRLVRAYIDHYERPDSSFIRRGTPSGNEWSGIGFAYAICLAPVARKAPDLLDLLIDHTNSRIRWDIAVWFESAGVYVPMRVHTLRTDESWQARLKAASLLGSEEQFRPGHKAYVISALRKALEDESRLVADAARDALLKLGAPAPSD